MTANEQSDLEFYDKYFDVYHVFFNVSVLSTCVLSGEKPRQKVSKNRKSLEQSLDGFSHFGRIRLIWKGLF